MRLIITLGDIVRFGIVGVLIIVAVIAMLYAVIEFYTREWRYKHFRCPRCRHYCDGHCDKSRNYGEECRRYSKKFKVDKNKNKH